MKHSFYFLLACLLFGACAKQSHVVSNPILPIHRTSDTTCINLTDYLPGIADGDTILVGNTLDVFSFAGRDIAVLPNLPTEQRLYSLPYEGDTIRIALTSGVDSLSIILLLDNKRIIDYEYNNKTYTISIFANKKHLSGRHFLRLFATDGQVLFNDIMIPLEDGTPITSAKQLTRHDDQAQVLYSLLVDRFCNGNTANDWKMNSPEVLDIVDYQGGDLAGITQKINEGFFDEMGISTIWISPITQNPWDAWGKYVFHNGNKYDSTYSYTKFSGYHGYWPINVTKIDERFGTDDELRQLLSTAHKHNINIILDYVANHMHINSPTFQDHPTWHTDSILPDGRRNFELWDEARLTTWFDTHIPTLDLERLDVCDPMTDSALYWLENFELDGFRHDACKHIPECYWRMLGQKMAKRFPDRHIWMIGETYGSPELINTYVKTGMLNAQFDFNIYFTAIHTLLGEGEMSNIDRVIRESIATYGAHHTMGNISGNHDQARFASLAGGALSFGEDAKEAGWTREVGIGNADQAYAKAILLEMLNFTIPGVPCVYQGDEFAEVGANDPDNRKMMRFEGLNDKEMLFRQQVITLAHLRRQILPLMYGDYIPVLADANTLIFKRIYLGQIVEVKISRNEESYITVDGERVFSVQQP